MSMTKTETPNHRAAQEIRALMAAKKKSITDLAEHLDISRSSASRRINGKAPLDLNEISYIAEWLNVPYGRIVNPPQQLAYSA